MRFLKKEWDDTEIPRDSMLRARNRAWRRIQDGPAPSRRRFPAWWLLPAGAAATAVIAVLALWPSAAGPAPQPLPLPDAPPIQVAAAGPLQVPAVLAEAEADPGWAGEVHSPWPPTASRTQEMTAQENLKTKTKIVFRLPRSGVRMIWMTQTSQGE